MTFVPYQGSAPAATAVMGQHVHLGVRRLRGGGGEHEGGQARALAVATMKRIDPLPDVPTFDEQGFKNLEVDNWFGIVAPAKRRRRRVASLADGSRRRCRTPR